MILILVDKSFNILLYCHVIYAMTNMNLDTKCGRILLQEE